MDYVSSMEIRKLKCTAALCPVYNSDPIASSAITAIHQNSLPKKPFLNSIWLKTAFLSARYMYMYMYVPLRFLIGGTCFGLIISTIYS